MYGLGAECVTQEHLCTQADALRTCGEACASRQRRQRQQVKGRVPVEHRGDHAVSAKSHMVGVSVATIVVGFSAGLSCGMPRRITWMQIRSFRLSIVPVHRQSIVFFTCIVRRSFFLRCHLYARVHISGRWWCELGADVSPSNSP